MAAASKKIAKLVATLTEVENEFEIVRNACKQLPANSPELTIKYYADQINPMSEIYSTAFYQYYELLEEEDKAAAKTRNAIFKQSFNELSIALLSVLPSSSAVANTTTSAGVSQPTISQKAKLPTIELPQFDGDLTKWIQFRDRFKALVHDRNDLSGSTKLHYLKSAIKDKGCVINDIAETNDSYEEAWREVISQYDKKRVLLDSHFNAFFSIKKMPATETTLSDLLSLYNDVNNHVQALERLRSRELLFGSLVVHQVEYRLNKEIKFLWKQQNKKELPDWADMKEFLKEQITIFQSLSSNKAKPFKSEFRPTSAHAAATSDQQQVPMCHLCNQDYHELWKCGEFESITPQQRNKAVKDMGLCPNCLRKHATNACRSSRRCKICNGFHHTSIHLDQSQLSATATSFEPHQSVSTTSAHAFHTSNRTTLLSTAIVHIRDRNGTSHPIRALLDSGSESCYITESAMDALKLPRSKAYMEVRGIGNQISYIKAKCLVSISSRVSEFNASIECLIVKNITTNLPSVPIHRKALKIPPTLQLADGSFDVPGRIDLLIGNELFLNLLTGESLILTNGAIMSGTKVGWIIGGAFNNASNGHSQSKCFTGVSNLQSLRNSIEQFWKMETHQDNKVHLTDEEAYCEESFQQTHSRLQSGTFLVQLPVKPQILPLVMNNRKQAEQRFLQLEKRLSKDNDLKSQYVDFMREYQSLGHMDKLNEVTRINSKETVFYLPHHPVFKLDSTTTKMRTVFDASAKTSSGVSLNDALCIGPQVQSDSFAIGLRFRQQEIVIKADISKMYRQIKVIPSQRPLQRILWRESPAEPLDTYELNTVTYGTASASFLATRCLKQLAIDHQETFPNAARNIRDNFYVDDLVAGARTIQDAKELQTQIHDILASAQLPLRKYCSNSNKLMSTIPAELHDKPDEIKQFIKALGIIWSVDSDVITFDLQAMSVSKPTKRNYLSSISKHYDPEGLTGPTTFNLKRFMKKIYQLKVGWDEPLNSTIIEEWQQISSAIQQLNNIAVPRQAFIKEYKQANLIGFCDASTHGYGAAVYIQSMDAQGNIASNILCSKSRIAPDEVKTIARLELCSCVLLSELILRCTTALHTNFNKIIAFSDSEIALYWIRKNPSQLKTFVANRVSTVQENSKNISWRHIPGNLNPADHISRGLNPSELIDCTAWWHGPDFLKTPIEQWPKASVTVEPQTEQYIIEIKPIITMVASAESNSFIQLAEKSSDHKRVVRITAYVLNFLGNFKILARRNLLPSNMEERSNSSEITVSLFNHAMDKLLQLHQQLAFADEWRCLSRGKEIASQSKVKNLNPFFDHTRQLLRVGGRLHKATGVSQDRAHPILMTTCQFMTSIIWHTHIENFHAGQQATLSAIRQTYWLINGKQVVRAVIHKCIRCIRLSPRMHEQFMGTLPSARVNQSQAFYHCGVDYAGPFAMKISNARQARCQKCYFAIFVCFATKATHIEIVSDLSSAAFIAALDRFFSLRGNCKFLYSDNGTNFVGANKILRNIFDFAASQQSQPEMKAFLLQREIIWKNIPPRAPQFGGLWEAAVKSAKLHMKRVLGEASLTYEELATVMHKIQAILNSRPITPLSNDPNDLQPLTPGHFLIGRPLVSKPESDLTNINVNRLTRWDRIIAIQQHFWHRWHNEYLTQLQVYKKNFKKRYDISIGQMVIIRRKDCPPLQWPLGRITQVHPGTDGIVRVVTVFNGYQEIVVPSFNICILPIAIEDSIISAPEHVES